MDDTLGTNLKAKKRIFLGLLLITVLFLFFLTVYFFLFVRNPQALFSRLFIKIMTILAFFCIFFFISGLLAIVFTIINKRPFPVLQWFVDKTLFFLFPIVIIVGRFLHITQDNIQRSFVEVNNQLVKSRELNLEGGELMLLLPHCLQNSSCTHKITHDTGNCRRCGGCQIGDILTMALARGIRVEVVTGGTLARRAVQKHRPRAIVAVACERDLSSGLLDVFPLPVLGVLNERPQGPCYNTRVNLSALEKALCFFLKPREVTSGGG